MFTQNMVCCVLVLDSSSVCSRSYDIDCIVICHIAAIMIDNEIILFALVKDLISKSRTEQKIAVSNRSYIAEKYIHVKYIVLLFHFLFGMSSSSAVCRSVLIQKQNVSVF